MISCKDWWICGPLFESAIVLCFCVHKNSGLSPRMTLQIPYCRMGDVRWEIDGRWEMVWETRLFFCMISNLFVITALKLTSIQIQRDICRGWPKSSSTKSLLPAAPLPPLPAAGGSLLPAVPRLFLSGADGSQLPADPLLPSSAAGGSLLPLGPSPPPADRRQATTAHVFSSHIS